MKRWQQEEATKRMIDRIKKMRRDISDVVNDDEKDVVQKEKVSQIFELAALNLEGAIKPQLQIFFNAVAGHPEEKFDKIVELLTVTIPQSQNEEEPSVFTPVIASQLPINADYLNLMPEDLKQMPGYILLHKVARHLDVAIKVANITIEENSSRMSAFNPPMLIVDITKSYAEGAEWNPGFYPDLPEVKKQEERVLPFEIRETISRKKVAKPAGDQFKVG